MPTELSEHLKDERSACKCLIRFDILCILIIKVYSFYELSHHFETNANAHHVSKNDFMLVFGKSVSIIVYKYVISIKIIVYKVSKSEKDIGHL